MRAKKTPVVKAPWRGLAAPPMPLTSEKATPDPNAAIILQPLTLVRQDYSNPCQIRYFKKQRHTSARVSPQVRDFRQADLAKGVRLEAQ